MSCPALLLTTSSLAGTPSPGPLRLVKTPGAGHPLPRGGEGGERSEPGEGVPRESGLSRITRDTARAAQPLLAVPSQARVPVPLRSAK